MSASARLSKGAAWEDLIAHYRHNEPGLMPVTPSSLMEEYCLPPASTEPIEVKWLCLLGRKAMDAVGKAIDCVLGLVLLRTSSGKHLSDDVLTIMPQDSTNAQKSQCIYPWQDMVLDVKHLAEVLFGLPADASLQLDGISLAGPSQPDDPAAEVPLQDRGTPAECSPQRNTAHPMSGEAQPCSGSDVPKPYHDAEAHAPNTDVRAPSTFAHAEARAPWELRHPTSAGMKADETAGARTVHQLAPAQAFPSNKEVAAHGGGSGADVQGSVAVKISAPEKSLEDWLNDL